MMEFSNSTVHPENKVKPAIKEDVVFTASLSFPHTPPYEALFAERVPVLQAFQSSCANFLMQQKFTENKFSKLFKASAQPFIAVECGVYTGNSLLACSKIAQDIGIPFTFYGLDTFSGLPPLSEKDRELAPKKSSYLRNQLFGDTSLDMVQERINAAGLDKNIQLHQGLFSYTLPNLPDQHYHFVNIDCDLYEPHIECLNYFYPRMLSGGIIFFDDYHSINYPMARAAIDTFLLDKPEILFHMRMGKAGPNKAKSMIIKN